MLYNQRQLVAMHQEVEPLRIMVSGGERDRVYLLFGEVPRVWRLLVVAVTGA
jgi:hypothetical protein